MSDERRLTQGIASNLAADASAAAARAMTFSVCRKDHRAGAWATVLEKLPDLVEALARARELDAFEVGVITDGPGRLAGYIYWTSAAPDLFNSSVITQVVI